MGKPKARKSDGINNLKSNAFIIRCHSLFTHIFLLFSAPLRHGVTPNNMLLATSIFSKILDIIIIIIIIIIIENNSSIFTSAEVQFGFKAKH